MMYQKQSGKGRCFKALALVPALVFAIAAMSIPQVNAAISTIGSSPATISQAKKKAVAKENKQKSLTDTVKVIRVETRAKKDTMKEETPTAISLRGDSVQERVVVNEYKLSLIPDGKNTLVTITGNQKDNEMSIADAELSYNGEVRKNANIKTSLKDGKFLAELTFPDITVDGVATLKAKINGKEVTFNVSITKFSIRAKEPPFGPELTITVDGVQITREQLEKLNANDIESVSVLKEDSKIIIVTKNAKEKQ